MVTKAEKQFAKNFNIDDLPDVPAGLPPHLKAQQTRVVSKNNAPAHVRTILVQSYNLLCSVLLVISLSNYKFYSFSQ